MIKNISFIVLLVLFLTAFTAAYLHYPILSENFTSPTYRIQMGNFNMTGGRKTSQNFRLTDTVGQNFPGQFTNSGFIIKSGFQYIHDTFNVFSFQINDLAIELGTLVPGVATTQANIITISTPSGNGYQIMAHEDHALALRSGTTIPDTRCDANTCTESVSGVWTSTSAYGFGFNAIGINNSSVATGVGTSNYFSNNTYYRQFANYSTNPPESAQIIMAESLPVKDHSARITYKANISPHQSAGQYSNSINFVAVPKY